MKLELKHLAPYLPYNVKVGFGSDEYQHELIGLDITNNGLSITSPFGDYGRASLDDAKPILTPLSELSFYSNGLRHLGYRIDQNNISNLTSDIERGEADYNIMQMCFKEHIDVFGLIEKGLAIDINTLAVNE